MASNRVYYVWDEKLIEQCDRLPAVPGRASMVHSLIMGYNILDKIKVVHSQPATYTELKEFHSELYLDHLKTFTEVDDEYVASDKDEEFGIGYDCPPVSNIFHLVATIAGGSLTAAKCLTLGIADIAINWCGGWHHAHRFGAEGFCYVNDIVLAIKHLKTKFPKVLYIDLDVHHGNGVQDAYNLSKSVFTLSFHKYEPGFYPGTGDINDIGSLTGKGYSCNFPFHAFYSDDTLKYAFEKIFNLVYSLYEPDVIILQCGADALAHDPNGGAAVTTQGYCYCVQMVLDKRKPTLILGGGGYKHTNAARLWTSITALIGGIKLDDNIPDHDYWIKFGPDYTLSIEKSLTKDKNTKQYLDERIEHIKGTLQEIMSQGSDTMEPILKRQKLQRRSMISLNRKKHTDLTNTLIKKHSVCNENKHEIDDIYTFTD